MPPPIDPALVLHAPPSPGAREAASGRALVAGAVGRLGEAVLNQVLARGGHAQVVALAQAPIALGIRGLALADLGHLPPLTDAYLVLADPEHAGARSFYGRDAAFTLVSRDNVLAVAQQALRAGARRLALIDPMPAWQQMSQFHRGLVNEIETAIGALPFDALVVIRPVRQGGRAAGGWVERFVQAYLSIQMLMLPRSIPALTSEQVARAAVAALSAASTGVQVINAQQIPGWLEAPG